ncbi:hypothetical protein GCM10025868_28900 [Angustibacter aerolatus]|uniref:Uncharacterized protein n=1 Tax=Angustibacter aerolatus TaxID=1162965 RepID=A0ABQ6JLH9_9ACTN|nr:hypothetical protein [Angustibacter aerolatus]GMA87640.1 hypothetical protein GCM10025868_28900 [Angustibacter aerolatus]
MLAGLPTLASDPGSLPDDALPWAATVLGNLAHAYWHFGLERMYEPRNLVDDNRLPPAIEVPWHEVCSRTGRPFCGLTLEDEMFNNFALEAPAVVGADGQYDVEDVRVDRITVPAAAYGSESERVFLAAFSEIHAMLAPIPGLLEEPRGACCREGRTPSTTSSRCSTASSAACSGPRRGSARSVRRPAAGRTATPSTGRRRS